MTHTLVLQNIASECVECNICVKECSFLDTYGSPGAICNGILGGTLDTALTFQCNLCGLCRTVCPKNLDIPNAFLESRQQNFHQKQQIHPAHQRICSYERRGSSKLFSLHHFPKGCTTIFFPGCTLGATKSKTTEQVYKFLQSKEKSIGLVLDCCYKPSHDLGHTDHFNTKFAQLIKQLESNGIRRILTACPSCYVTFQEYAPHIEIQSVYEELCVHNFTPEPFTETVTIHDACMTRLVTTTHDSVRTLLKEGGATIVESPHSGTKAICCGDGAAATFIAPEITDNWGQIRKQESSGKRVITYCAGCSSRLEKTVHTTHLLDLLFNPHNSTNGKEQKTKAPFTYLRRYQLKRRIQKSSQKVKKTVPRQGLSGKSVLLVLLLASIVGIRMSGIQDSLHIDNIEEILSTLQHCPPIIYIGLLSLVPVFFLPGFPFVIAGGLLYGHTWGLLYAMLGATAGAGLSFLVSRYIANDWMTEQMKTRIDEKKWIQLQQKTENHGWKIVMFLRLVPLFPFTPLNYALGLTNIRFSHYIVATSLGIFPACAAFILFSSSLWDVINGENLIVFLIGCTLVAVTLLIPFIYKRYYTPSH